MEQKPSRNQLRSQQREADKINDSLNKLVAEFVIYCKEHFNQDRVDKFKALQEKWITVCNQKWKYKRCTPTAFATLCEMQFKPVAGVTTKGKIIKLGE